MCLFDGFAERKKVLKTETNGRPEMRVRQGTENVRLWVVATVPSSGGSCPNLAAHACGGVPDNQVRAAAAHRVQQNGIPIAGTNGLRLLAERWSVVR